MLAAIQSTPCIWVPIHTHRRAIEHHYLSESSVYSATQRERAELQANVQAQLVVVERLGSLNSNKSTTYVFAMFEPDVA